jgi:CheY-like chemotaxis protein
MPEMDGLALAEAVRGLPPPVANLPLVLLTSAGKPEPEPEHVQLAGVLTKPVKPSQLYDLLTTIFDTGAWHAAPVAPPNTPAAALPLPAQSVRILLAEDVLVNQKFALAALEQLGFRADIAADGREALAAVRRQPYDVVLMDVHMPQMDGLEATRQIRRLPAEFDAPGGPYIIAMTANALEGDREACLAAGMDDYISKPVYLHELALALQRAAASLPDSAGPAAQGNPPASAELIDLYLEEALEYIAALTAGVAAADLSAVEHAAHSLKGMSGQVGAAQVEALAEALERAARSGAAIDDLHDLRAQLEEEFAQARVALIQK